MTIVAVDNTQNAQQSISNEVTVESTLELVEHLSRRSEIKEELRNLIQQYQEEITQDEPDKSLLRRLIGNAKEKSPELAANLGMLALQQGLIGVLNLQ